jgi:uncharacterized protein (TIGR02145 family)
MRFITVLTGFLLAATVHGQSIVTPVFVLKDGEASATGFAGSEKELYIDGGAQQSTGWITFQAAGTDVSKIASAKLTLFVKQVQSPGTLGIYPLTAAINAPENNVPLASIPVGATAAATVSLGTADVEKMAQVDLTSLVKGGSFHGVALLSDDGLRASFDAKEGRLAPVILLMHDIESAAAKWNSGASAPESSLGRDGDYYLNTANGDVSAKSGGVWSVAMNVVGDTGPQGSTGAQGPKGDKGDQGDQGAQGEIGVTGPAGEDGKSIDWRNAWNALARYALNDAVSYSGSAYIAIASSSGKNPADSVAYWQPMALKGDRGPTGETGPQGPQGTAGATGATGPAGENGHSPVTTSSTPLSIGSSGNVTLTFAYNRLAFGGGQRLRLTSGAAWMEGVITAYNSSTGVATVTLDNSAGSGTFSSWTVTVAGTFPSGAATGDMQYWDGTKWVRIPAGHPGHALTLSGSSVPQWSQIPGTLTDIDGNLYRTIVIGNQEWTLTNLKTTKLNDGTAIPNVTGATAWSAALTTPAYCWYGNDVANKEKYGALYNWATVNTGNLSPADWRVPTDADWTALENYLIANGYNYDGTLTGNKIAKSMGACIWTSSTGTGAVGNNLSINNKSGFSGLGGGNRDLSGTFYNQSYYGFWWSATEVGGSNNAYSRYLHYDESDLNRNYYGTMAGFSVRLVRDLD